MWCAVQASGFRISPPPHPFRSPTRPLGGGGVHLPCFGPSSAFCPAPLPVMTTKPVRQFKRFWARRSGTVLHLWTMRTYSGYTVRALLVCVLCDGCGVDGLWCMPCSSFHAPPEPYPERDCKGGGISGVWGGGGAGLRLKGRGGRSGQFRSGCRAGTGDVKAVGGWAVTGSWKCGWGWCWRMGMPLG